MQTRRSSYLYLIILGIIVLAFAVFPLLSGSRDRAITNTQFETYLKDSKIKEAVINQNEEVPTGSVDFTLKDGTRGSIYVSDVAEVQKELSDNSISYTVNNVARTSSMASLLLPLLAVVGGFFIISMFMS